MPRILLAALCLGACSADEARPADPNSIAAAVDHAELELERSRGGAAEPRTEAAPE